MDSFNRRRRLIKPNLLPVDTRKMAEVSSLFSQLRVSNSYIPTSPPKPPKATSSYARSVQDAPYTALSGVIKDGRVPERHPVFPRCRERHQVGGTNRWRLPESLYSDLLGNAQALKAVHMPYNTSMLRIITAENPKLCINLECESPYSFHRQSLSHRPHTAGAAVAVTSHEQRPSPSYHNNIADGACRQNEGKEVVAPSSVPRLSFRSKSLPVPAGPLKTFVPKSALCRTPKELFLYHSKKSMSYLKPDVLLKCVGIDWELHRPFLQKSETLGRLLSEVDGPSVQNYHHCPNDENLNNHISHSNFYSSEYKEKMQNGGGGEKGEKWKEEEGLKTVEHSAHLAEKHMSSLSILHLDIDDPLVTKRAMAIALGNLYHDDLDVDLDEVSGVMAAAQALGFKQLIDGCAQIMLKSINYHTVCRYQLAASKYHQENVALACERWLELNLIPKLSMQIQLREISMELLRKILESSRLFVYNEYSVFRTLAYWLFLQMNPNIQLMPSHSTVLSFFNSLPKTTSFLESDEGRVYLPLFQAIRLHGITDTCHLQDMQVMNILPQAWLISILSQHYYALQGGGDMPSVRNFHTCAIRQGFTVDDETHYHSEVLSLHGFHFELKAVREDASTYVISMERLKPGDPILSFRQCERHTFSMRSDREVRYCITVQTLNLSEHYHHTTGVLAHNFGLGQNTCRSQVLKLSSLREPIYVSFTLLFPPS